MKSIKYFVYFKVLFLTVIFCMLSMPALADQNKDFYLDSRMQQMYTANDGLPTTATNAIAQTSDGFMWFGGYGGLARFDGKKFRIYGAGQLSNVKCLLSDSRDVLWIGSTDQGLAKYENDVITFLEWADGSEHGTIECLLETDAGIFFGTSNGLGKVNDNGEMEKLNIPELEHKYIRRIVNADGKILCVTRDGKLFIYDGEICIERKLDIGDFNIRCIYHCPVRKEYMIGTDTNGVFRCDSYFQVKERIIIREAECINAVRYTDNDEIMIATDNGVLVYSEGEVRKQQLQLDNSVDDMYVDFEGNYWFISSRKGVVKVSNSRFFNITHSASIDHIVANAVLKTKNRLYIGHDEGLEIVDLISMDKINDKAFDGLEGVRIRDILQDSKGQIWFCTKEHGLFCYQPNGTWKIYSSEEYEVLQSDSFRCIAETDNGKIIVGSESGAYVLDGDSVTPMIKDMSQISFRILGIMADGDTYYLGTDGYGALRIQDGEIKENYSIENGLLSNVVMKYRKSDTQNCIWMVTGNSIACLKNDGSLKNIENLPFTNILDFILLEDGTVWILTGGGIYKIAETALLDNSSSYEMLSKVDGIPFECTANSRQYMENDTLYVCGTEGVFSMKLVDSSDKFENYPLTIDYLYTDDQLLYVKNTDQVHIPSEIKRICIQPHVPSFIPENPSVFYYLENFDRKKEVIKLRDLDEIVYTNLDGEEYVFHFGILDEEKNTIIKEITLTIQKEKTLLEYPITKACLLLLTFGVIYHVFSLFEKRKEKKLKLQLEEYYEKQEKENLTKMAYRDYLTGLYSRNYISKWKTEWLEKAEYPISLIMIDCNNLKVTNDTYGHEEGDRLLTTVAHYLMQYFMEPESLIIRMGGDEFMVICNHMPREICVEKMQQIQKDMEYCYISDIPVSFCYGTAEMVQDNSDFEDCMKRADQELIQEKRRYHDMVDKK